VPYALPDNKTMSTLKSNSSKGGGGFNELRFEDKKGSEQVFIHAEKQLDIRVKADRYETIGNDRHLVVENDKFEHIKNNRHELIDANHKETIKVDRNLIVGGKEAVEITGSKSLTVADDVIEVFKANQSTQITADLFIKAENIVIEAGTNITFKVGETWIAIESTSVDLKTKDATFKTDANFKVEATANFEVKATADAKLEGLTFKAKGSTTAEMEGSASFAVKGGVGDVKASGPLTVKGAITNVG
jgi:type VI secretion system secreted protein VgrG